MTDQDAQNGPCPPSMHVCGRYADSCCATVRSYKPYNDSTCVQEAAARGDDAFWYTCKYYPVPADYLLRDDAQPNRAPHFRKEQFRYVWGGKYEDPLDMMAGGPFLTCNSPTTGSNRTP